MRGLEEKTCKSVTKTFSFEKKGETLSVTISIENVSPNTSKDAIDSMVNALFESAKSFII